MSGLRHRLDALGYAQVVCEWPPPTVEPHPLCAAPSALAAYRPARPHDAAPSRGRVIVTALALAVGAASGIAAASLARRDRTVDVSPAPVNDVTRGGDASSEADLVEPAP